MATNVHFKPKLIDFRAVRPNSVSEWAESVYAVAPTTTTVSATIVGDRQHFRVDGMRSYLTVTRPFTAQEIEELPPLQRPQAALRTIVEDILMGSTDGEAPLTVQAEEKLAVLVKYSAHSLTPGQDNYDATLRITADDWEPVELPVTMLVGYIETTFPSNLVVVRQGRSAQLPFTARSVAGPDTAVLYLKRPYQVGDYFRMPPYSLTLARGQVVSGQLEINAPPHSAVGTATQSDITLFAFDGKQVEELITTVKVLPGLVTVKLGGSANVVGKQGTTASLPLTIETTGSTTVIFSPTGALPQGVLAAPKSIEAHYSWGAHTFPYEFQIDGNAPIVSNVPISVGWSSADGDQTGSVSATLTIQPGIGVPTRVFNPATHGFPFPNKWSFTEEDGRAMMNRFQVALPAVAAVEMSALSEALKALSVSVPLWGTVALPSALVTAVMAKVAPDLFAGLNAAIIGAISGEYGRCGGMAFAGYDFFLRGWRVDQFGDMPLDADNLRRPPASGELRMYIWHRLLDSLDRNAGRFFEWIAELHVLPVVSRAANMALGALAGTVVGGPVGAAIGALVGSKVDILSLGGERRLRDRTRNEMNMLKQILAREAAWPIGVVYGHSANPTDQHQILAIKYTEQPNGTAILDAWDNNDGNRARALTLDFSGNGLVVTQRRGTDIVSASKPIKGLFCEDYYSIQPPLILRQV